MPSELITLTPTGGAGLTIDDAYQLGTDLDWGDQTTELSLAEGPDVVGGVVGTRRRGVTTATIPIQILSTDAETYLEAAEEIARVASELAARGGTVQRQVDFGDGNLSELLESEVLGCDLTIESSELWFQAHRRHSVHVLTLTRQPDWLAIEELVGSESASVDSITEVDVSMRGNLPGPGRVVITDNATQRRRFVELGGAFREFDSGVTVQFAASDFELAEAALVASRLDLTPVLPTWQPLGYLRDLDNRGGLRARARVRFPAGSDASVLVRLAYKTGGGVWHELEPVSIPTFTPTDWADVDLGYIGRFDRAEFMDLRVDVWASAVDATNTFALNTMSLLPTELYTVARGIPVQGVAAGLVAYDDFSAATVGALTGQTAPVGGNWLAAGDTSPAWNVAITSAGVGKALRYGAADVSLQAGGIVLLGPSGLIATTVAARLAAWPTSLVMSAGDDWIVAALLRYVDTSNFLAVALKIHATGSSQSTRAVQLRKVVAGSLTILSETFADDTPLQTGMGLLDGNVACTVAADGSWRVSGGPPDDGLSTTQVLDEGLDSALATAGALAAGRVGIYHASEGFGSGQVYAFSAHDESAPSELTDVVRSGGIGELNSVDAFSSESDGTDPAPVPVYGGSRIWLPPGDGRLYLKVRRNDDESEADDGLTDSTDIDVYHRPAFATLSDALGA